MTRKANAISTLARETMARIVGSPAAWEAFLRSAARMYKYAFPEQVLIYAQRPNATACATLEQWNRCRYRRWVKPGAVGIALLEDAGPQLGLKYVFDLSDTRQTPYTSPFPPGHTGRNMKKRCWRAWKTTLAKWRGQGFRAGSMPSSGTWWKITRRNTPQPSRGV